MGVPEEIRKVPRPKNTVVIKYKSGVYAVRERVGCRNVDGRRIPVEGSVIGHIVDGEYVPIDGTEKCGTEDPDLRDWANVTLISSVGRDILDLLKEYWHIDEARQLWCMAVLRVCYPGVKDKDLKRRYDAGFLSIDHPGVALSRNTVCDLHQRIGANCARIFEFMRDRASAAVGHRIVLDSTLKSDESLVNSLSEFSRKAATKGTRDISLMYAFDLDTGEPVCSKAYPGNTLDSAAFGDFVETCGIRDAFVIADKGFTLNKARDTLAKAGVSYLLPLRRGAKKTRNNGMLDFDTNLEGFDGVTCKKVKVADKCWLYSFRDPRRAYAEELKYLEKRKGDKYDPVNHEWLKPEFGVIVFESDRDMPLDVAYRAYSERWLIEMVFRFYKSSEELDETRVHSDWSVISSEFVNFLATLISFRLLKRFAEVPETRDESYGEVMSILERAKKARIDDKWIRTKVTDTEAKVLAGLGLIETPIVPKSRGRPRKSKA